jgi:O-antigen/teichoic acid export membrane protein
MRDSANKSSLLGKPGLKSQLLGGSLTLLAGSGLVGVTNLVYNVATARLLGPTGFAHATAVYTLLMLMSAVTLSFQVVCAKYVARTSSAEEKARVFARLHQRAWMAGIAIGILLLLGRNALARYLNLPDPNLISLLALGTTFYIPLGARRGYIQGIHAFGPLAINFMLEGLVRLGGVFLLIALGLGVKGAVLASVIAVIVTYVVAFPRPHVTSFSLRGMSIPFREGLQAIVFFSGQTIINNFDIILVKHFFPPDEAGLYAAIALIGRLVNMCAWSVVNTMFPVSAGASSDEHENSPVLFTSLSLVFLILTVLIVGLWIVPSFLWRTLFGAHFEIRNYGGLASLLILYAITTGIYSLSSVIITYEMSRKIANTSWVQLAFSGTVAVGIYTFHHDLRQVILVQLILMAVLLAVLLVPLMRRRLTPAGMRTYSSLRLRRPLSEEEVIAGFLKSEFHHPEFEQYRGEFSYLVRQPDFGSPRENALRRALLFLRRGTMWRELPGNTKWFVVDLNDEDLARVRVFPRAQWRRVAQGNFHLKEVVEHIRQKVEESSDDDFFRKLRVLSGALQESLPNPTVLLIGIDDKGPLTILDGNHRMAATLLNQSSATLGRLEFICGFSPDMIHCCWYYTNLNTLMRYFKNLVLYITYDAQAAIGRFQASDPGGVRD